MCPKIVHSSTWNVKANKDHIKKMQQKKILGHCTLSFHNPYEFLQILQMKDHRFIPGCVHFSCIEFISFAQLPHLRTHSILFLGFICDFIALFLWEDNIPLVSSSCSWEIKVFSFPEMVCQHPAPLPRCGTRALSVSGLDLSKHRKLC